MKIEFHGGGLLARFPFTKVPDGDYEVRTTAYPDNLPAFDFMWPVTVKDDCMTAHPSVPHPLRISVDKTRQCVRFENETETGVTIVIEQKDA